MKPYAIKLTPNQEYIAIILCLTTESIMTYLDQIEKNPMLDNKNGILIIDQLLLTGNTLNRYVQCEFKNRHLQISSTIKITPTSHHKALSLKLLQENYNSLDTSILTDREKSYIQHNILF